MLGGLIVSGTLGLLAAGILTGGFGGIGDFPSRRVRTRRRRHAIPAADRHVRDGRRRRGRGGLRDGRARARRTADPGPSRASTTAASDPTSRPTGSLDVKPGRRRRRPFLGERDRWVVRLPTGERLDLRLSVDAGEAVADLGGARLGVVRGGAQRRAAPRSTCATSPRSRGSTSGINAGSLGLYLPGGVDDRHDRGERRQRPAVRPAGRRPPPAHRATACSSSQDFGSAGARPGGRRLGDPRVRHGRHPDRAPRPRPMLARSRLDPRGGLLVSGRGPIAAGLVLIVIGGAVPGARGDPGLRLRAAVADRVPRARGVAAGPVDPSRAPERLNRPGAGSVRCVHGRCRGALVGGAARAASSRVLAARAAGCAGTGRPRASATPARRAIATLAAGEVRVSGRIESAEVTLVSPLQSAPCVYYRSSIEIGDDDRGDVDDCGRGTRGRVPGGRRDRATSACSRAGRAGTPRSASTIGPGRSARSRPGSPCDQGAPIAPAELDREAAIAALLTVRPATGADRCDDADGWVSAGLVDDRAGRVDAGAIARRDWRRATR